MPFTFTPFLALHCSFFVFFFSASLFLFKANSRTTNKIKQYDKWWKNRKEERKQESWRLSMKQTTQWNESQTNASMLVYNVYKRFWNGKNWERGKILEKKKMRKIMLFVCVHCLTMSEKKENFDSDKHKMGKRMRWFCEGNQSGQLIHMYVEFSVSFFFLSFFVPYQSCEKKKFFEVKHFTSFRGDTRVANIFY